MSIGTLFVQGPQFAFINGAISPGALLNFYVTGTSTPANVYSDSALLHPFTNPVQADGSGMYPPIFLDPTVTYKVVQTDVNGANDITTDPVSSNVAAITGALGLGSAAFAALGATGATVPLLNANLTFGGVNNHLGLETFSAGAALTPRAAPLSSDVGFMGWPQSARGANYVLTAADLGDNQVFNGAYSMTIPLNLAPAAGQLGQLIRGTWPNGFAGTVVVGTVVAAAGVTIRWPTGNVTTTPRTITGPGTIILEQMYLNEWWIDGAWNLS